MAPVNLPAMARALTAAAAAKPKTETKLEIDGSGFNLPNGVQPYVHGKGGEKLTATLLIEDGFGKRVKYEAPGKTPIYAVLNNEKKNWNLSSLTIKEGQETWVPAKDYQMASVAKRWEQGGFVRFIYNEGPARIEDSTNNTTFDKANNPLGGDSRLSTIHVQGGYKGEGIYYRSPRGTVTVRGGFKLFGEYTYANLSGGSSNTSGTLAGHGLGGGVEINPIAVRLGRSFAFEFAPFRAQVAGGWIFMTPDQPFSGLVYPQPTPYSPATFEYISGRFTPVAIDLRLRGDTYGLDLNVALQGQVTSMQTSDLGAKPVNQPAPEEPIPARALAYGAGVAFTASIESVANPRQAPLGDNCTPNMKKQVLDSAVLLAEKRAELMAAAQKANESGKDPAEVRRFLVAELAKARTAFIFEYKLATKGETRRTLMLAEAEGKLKKGQTLDEAAKSKIDKEVRASIAREIGSQKKEAKATDEALAQAVLPDSLVDSYLTQVDGLGSKDNAIALYYNEEGAVYDVKLPDANTCGDLPKIYQAAVTAFSRAKAPEPKVPETKYETVVQPAILRLNALFNTPGTTLNFKKEQPGVAFDKEAKAVKNPKTTAEKAYAKATSDQVAWIQKYTTGAEKGKSPVVKVTDRKGKVIGEVNEGVKVLQPFMVGDRSKPLTILAQIGRLELSGIDGNPEDREVTKKLAPYITYQIYGFASKDGDAEKNNKLSLDRAGSVANYLVGTGTTANITVHSQDDAKKVIIGQDEQGNNITLFDLATTPEMGKRYKKYAQFTNRAIVVIPTITPENRAKLEADLKNPKSGLKLEPEKKPVAAKPTAASTAAPAVKPADKGTPVAAAASRPAVSAARAKAEADAKAKADAKVKAEADAKVKAEADAKAKAEADAKAKAEADAKAKADAKVKAEADAKAKADTGKKPESTGPVPSEGEVDDK